MKKVISGIIILGVAILSLSFVNSNENEHSLTITVNNLRNDAGVVQFTLYNREGTIPDEHYKSYYLQQSSKINNHTSTIVFNDLPEGTYAINILHDEDENGEIKKGWILPIEGIGFSNFDKIGFGNRPNFTKASFELKADLTQEITIVYM